MRKLLLKYIKENNIGSGAVFCTSSGKAVDRSNVWREIKALGEEACVQDKKIFPHNFRHLFAKTFYEKNRDLAKLADVLGHSSIETTRILYLLYTINSREIYLLLFYFCIHSLSSVFRKVFNSLYFHAR